MLRTIEPSKKLVWPVKSQLIICALIFGLLAAMITRTEAGTVSYVYDNGNRLLAAFDGNGNVANYQYDRVGNITAIVSGSASSVAVFGYSPDNSTGAQVTIFGNNFSATASQDTVTFGGTAASVVSATTTTIVVSPPSIRDAVAVTVTCPAGSATGPDFYP
jgi:YD repeat-containing protein